MERLSPGGGVLRGTPQAASLSTALAATAHSDYSAKRRLPTAAPAPDSVELPRSSAQRHGAESIDLIPRGDVEEAHCLLGPMPSSTAEGETAARPSGTTRRPVRKPIAPNRFSGTVVAMPAGVPFVTLCSPPELMHDARGGIELPGVTRLGKGVARDAGNARPPSVQEACLLPEDPANLRPIAKPDNL